MGEEDFARRVHAAGSRLAVLLDEALAASEGAGDDFMLRILQELSTGIEELRVAEEELIVQGEQLAVNHLVVDAERERYGRLFDFAPDGYLETDRLGKILEANVAASHLLGVPVRYLVNKLVASFVEENDRRRVRTLIAAAGDGQVPDGELRVQVVPRDGEPVPVGITVAADLDPRDGELRIRWLLRDLTARLKEEEERRALQGEVDLLVSLAEVGRLTEGEDPLGAVLHGLQAVTCELFDDVTVSTTVVGRDGGLSTAASTDAVGADLSELQHETGEGPCVEAARKMVVTEAPIDEVEERWPALANAARRADVVEIFGLPIVVDGVAQGALNVYSRTTTTPAAKRALHLLAEQASAAVGNAELYRSAAQLADQLAVALETRVVIEQAKGALMAIQKVDADGAFDVLRRASQRRNQKLRDVASQFLEQARRQSAEES